MFDAEWEFFKTAIDLRAYAATEGYVIDQKESWRGSTVMRHSNGDKIVVSRKADGHYTFFSVRRDGDCGTIIDFIKRRKSPSFSLIRDELRRWLAMPAPAPLSLPPLHSTAKNRAGVESRYRLMSFISQHRYLERERCIPASVLQYWRFAGRIKADRYSNAVFPHFDTDGLCGYELRNSDFKGFSSGGTKGLWLSKTSPTDCRLVFCESTIDAISHAVLFPEERTRYASVGGKLNPVLPILIRAQIVRMPSGSEIVAAMDADQGGEQLADAIQQAFSGEVAKTFRNEHPVGFNDWNDQLRSRSTTIGIRLTKPSIRVRELAK